MIKLANSAIGSEPDLEVIDLTEWHMLRKLSEDINLMLNRVTEGI